MLMLDSAHGNEALSSHILEENSYPGPCVPTHHGHNSSKLSLRKKKKLKNLKDGNMEESYSYRQFIPEENPPIRRNPMRCKENHIVAFTEPDTKIYPCRNVHLEAYLPLSEMNATLANDLWGKTINGIEYAVVGLSDGTSFISLDDTTNPIVIGKLPGRGRDSWWRDVKTYQNFAVIVADTANHGLQVFDMNQLEEFHKETEFINKTKLLEETAHFDGFGNAHNLFINEDSATAYVVGSDKCNGGLYMINLTFPELPSFLHCYGDRGYTHDVQCVVYDGPDKYFIGREICFAANENTLDIIDVTKKTKPQLISSFTYDDHGYIHQGWLTKNKKYFVLDDEYDELYNIVENTRTVICDVQDLKNPILHDIYYGNSTSIDHNLYIRNDLIFQANYMAGFRILDGSSLSSSDSYDGLTELGYFDIYPQSDDNQFNGAWSNYPFYKSKIVTVSGIEQGLFVLRPDEKFFASYYESSIEEDDGDNFEEEVDRGSYSDKEYIHDFTSVLESMLDNLL